jgi:hypothetical protein
VNEQERIERLEKLVAKMASALWRMDSEQSGNWGWPSFHKEMGEIQRDLYPDDNIPLRTGSK